MAGIEMVADTTCPECGWTTALCLNCQGIGWNLTKKGKQLLADYRANGFPAGAVLPAQGICPTCEGKGRV